MDKEVTTVSDIKEIAQKDLTFQRFVFRKAWGTYFAIWATLIAYSVLLPDPSPLAPLIGDLDLVVYFLITVAVVLIVIEATVRITRTWDRTLILRGILNNDGNQSKRSTYERIKIFFGLGAHSIYHKAPGRDISSILCRSDILCLPDTYRGTSHSFFETRFPHRLAYRNDHRNVLPFW